MARKLTYAKARMLELQIENFRCIRQLLLDFENPKGDVSPVIVLGGPNGSGKTTVLEAGLLAANHAELALGPKGPASIRAGAEFGRIKAKFQLPERPVWTEILFRPGADPERVWESEDGVRGKEQPFDVPCIYFSSWRSPKLVGPLPVTAGRGGRLPSDTEYNRLWRAKQYVINAKAHARMGGESSRYDDIIERLNETWGLFYRGRGQVFSVEPVSDDPETGFDVFLYSPGDRKVPVDSLSSGQLEIFTFSAWLLRANSEAGIIFIDEPELHLDPQWHAVIVRAIRKLRPESQIVVATHSPQVFDTALSFERRFLVSDEDPRTTTWNAVKTHAG